MVNYYTLNENLAIVEKTINSKYHFSFSELQEDDNHMDYLTTVLHVRVLTEGICRYIVLYEHFSEEENLRNATLKVYVNDILWPKLNFPKKVLSILSIIQGYGNRAVHFQIEDHDHLDFEEVNLCMESFEALVSWFVTTYASGKADNNRWKIKSDVFSGSGSIPPKSIGCIISREKEVNDVRQKITSQRKVTIGGDTGIGKTEIVKDYAKKFRKKYDGMYYSENVENVNDFIYELPIGGCENENKDKEEIVKEKIEELHSMGLKYLFIIDNYVGDINNLQPLFPTKTDKYHLLVLINSEVENSETDFVIQPFSQEDSIKIFRYFCDIEYKDEEIIQLLTYLSYNPRAIRMCASFLNLNNAYTPIRLLENMKRSDSVNSNIKSIYIMLYENSLLEKDELMKTMVACLSLIPYNGMSKERFLLLVSGCLSQKTSKEVLEAYLSELEEIGWLSFDNVNSILINPLLSDVLFEKTKPDMTSDCIVRFLNQILKPISDIREMYLSQIMAMKPFVDQLTKRVANVERCNLEILNFLREYYIAIYDVPNIGFLTDMMEREIKQILSNKACTAETAIYRQGIGRFNMEDFNEAHIHFERALNMLNNKLCEVEKTIAMISAYEGSALAMLGKEKEAIENAKRSIDIREKLGADGDTGVQKSLWISYYNYAKTLYELEKYAEADIEIDKSIDMYKKYYINEFEEKSSTDVSSLYQMKGRIIARLGKKEEAINLLEESKLIRERLKGENYFSTAQVYSYLMEVCAQYEVYDQALKYANKFLAVLEKQYRTDDIKMKLENVTNQIKKYRECLGYE